MKFYEKTLKEEEIFKGKILDVRIQTVELPDGKISTREIVKHPGAVAIVAFKDENTILMVEQFRKPLQCDLLELPAGKLEYEEDPLECAKRELEEETGFKAENFEYLGKICTTPGFSNEIIHLYKATSLVSGTIGGDDDEFIDVHEVKLKDIREKIKKGEIIDSKTISAFMFL